MHLILKKKNKKKKKWLIIHVISFINRLKKKLKNLEQLYMNRLTTKPTKILCAQRRLRSAWASAQSDQSLRCALDG